MAELADQWSADGVPNNWGNIPVVQEMAQAVGAGTWATIPRVIGGRYGLSSTDFSPAMAKAALEELSRVDPAGGFAGRISFTFAIDDDVSPISSDTSEDEKHNSLEPLFELITQSEDIEDASQTGWLSERAPRARVAMQTSSHEAAVVAAINDGGLACLARPRGQGDRAPETSGPTLCADSRHLVRRTPGQSPDSADQGSPDRRYRARPPDGAPTIPSRRRRRRRRYQRTQEHQSKSRRLNAITPEAFGIGAAAGLSRTATLRWRTGALPSQPSRFARKSSRSPCRPCRRPCPCRHPGASTPHASPAARRPSPRS